MKKLLMIIGTLILLSTLVYFLFFRESYPDDIFENDLSISLPNSKYHINATWWGYNQSKLYRLDDKVFTYYIDNDTQIDGTANINNPNQAVLVVIHPDGTYEEFDSIVTSRPINVVVDDTRNLIYYIVGEPTILDNGSTVRLVMYTYHLDNDTITFIKKETVVDHTPSDAIETVNIRIGSTIDSIGNIAIAYGLAEANYTFSMVVQLYDVINETWTEKSINMGEFGEPNFYPDIAMKSLDDFFIVAIQDKCDELHCYYQYLRYFRYLDDTWTYDYVVDYRNLEIASTKPILLEHTEVYIDANHVYHVVYRSMLNKEKIIHAYLSENNTLISRDLDVHRDLNWVRIIELNDIKYFIGHGNERTQIINFDTLEVLYNDTNSIDKCYFYAFSDNMTYIDTLTVSGNSDDYSHTTEVLYKRFILQ